MPGFSGLALILVVLTSCLWTSSYGQYNQISRDELRECDESRVVYRNFNQTCPPRAICADVFDTVRNWFGFENREPCREHRVLHNCMCPELDQDGHVIPGGQPTYCPFNNHAHRLHNSITHTTFTCRPACTLPYCNNLAQRQSGRPNAAQTMVQDDIQFNRRNYYRMECRCPRHHFPSERRGRPRAVSHFTTSYDFGNRRVFTQYQCRHLPIEAARDDPCPSPENE